MTAASPLRGPKSIEGGGFAAAHLRGAPRRLRGRSSGLKGALRRFAPAMAMRPPLTPETSAAPGAGRAVRPRACPGQARGAQARRGGRLRIPGRQGTR